jgi:hypothetical protein
MRQRNRYLARRGAGRVDSGSRQAARPAGRRALARRARKRLEAGSWRAIFLINVSVAAAAAWITRRHVPESRDTSLSGSVGWPSALASARRWPAPAALAAITYAIIVLPGGGVRSPGFTAAAVLAPRRRAPVRRLALIQTRCPTSPAQSPSATHTATHPQPNGSQASNRSRAAGTPHLAAPG